MALFTTDYTNSNNDKFAAVPEGDYECIITKAGWDVTSGGTEYFGITLKVRDDLDAALPETNGRYHRRLIFVNFWKDKKTGKLDENHIMRVLQAAGVPEGTSIESWDQLDMLLHNLPVSAHVTVDDYRGIKRNRVASWNFKPTSFPLAEQSDPFKAQKDNSEVANEKDLPF